eukprot:g80101.t1
MNWKGACGLLLVCTALLGHAAGARRTLRVALVGDSLTYGNGSMSELNIARPHNRGSYPLLVRRAISTCHLPGYPVDVRIFAHGGRTAMRREHLTQRAGPEMSFWESPVFPQLLQFAPHIMVLMLGTNDSKENSDTLRKYYATDLEDMVRTVNASLRTYVLLPPTSVEFGERLQHLVRPTLLQLVAKLGQTELFTHRIGLLDAFPVVTAKELQDNDGLHPIGQAMHHLGQCVYVALARDFPVLRSAACLWPDSSDSSPPPLNPSSASSHTNLWPSRKRTPG